MSFSYHRYRLVIGLFWHLPYTNTCYLLSVIRFPIRSSPLRGNFLPPSLFPFFDLIPPSSLSRTFASSLCVSASFVLPFATPPSCRRNCGRGQVVSYVWSSANHPHNHSNSDSSFEAVRHEALRLLSTPSVLLLHGLRQTAVQRYSSVVPSAHLIQLSCRYRLHALRRGKRQRSRRRCRLRDRQRQASRWHHHHRRATEASPSPPPQEVGEDKPPRSTEALPAEPLRLLGCLWLRKTPSNCLHIWASRNVITSVFPDQSVFRSSLAVFRISSLDPHLSPHPFFASILSPASHK